MRTYKQILLAAASGVLVCFSFPTVLFGWKAPEFGVIGWVALVPLLIAVRDSAPRRAFVLTFLSSMIWYGGSLYWVFRAMHTYGKMSAFTSALVTVLLVVFVSLYISVAPMLARWVSKYFRGEVIVLLPVMWVAAEFCRNYIPFNGFPWSNIAMSQYKVLPAIQMVDLVGIYGLIFAMVWVNQYLAELVLRLRREPVNNFAQKTVTTAVLLAVILAYGAAKLYTVPSSFKRAPNINIAMIQGNIEQGDKWNEKMAQENLDVYRSGVQKLRNAPLDLIIWPEASYPAYLKTTLASLRPQTLGFTGMELTRQPYTLLGAVAEEPTGDMRNSAFLFDARGRIEGMYHKAHLVPFGEYVPYRKLFFFAKKLTAPVGNFIEGSSYEPLEFDGNRMGVLICYEDIFPEISRKTVKAGAQFLANVTNDAWYGVSSAPYQHLAISVFRAVENRRFMVRATNSGVSAVVDPWGRILMQSKIFERSIMVGTIVPLEDLSPYTRLGDWLAWGAVAYTLFCIAITAVRRIKEARE